MKANIENPAPLGYPWDPNHSDPDERGVAPGTLLECGCHQRVDDESWLCEQHLADLNSDRGT